MKARLPEGFEWPSWFRLDRYEPARTFGLADWHKAFWARWFTYSIRYQIIQDPTHKDDRDSIEKYEQFWSEIRNHGANALLNDLPHAGSDSTECVRSLQVMDLFELGEALSEVENYKGAYTQFWKELDAQPVGGQGLPTPKKLEELAHDVIHPDRYWQHNFALAIIDLDASDATILENCARWLKKVRIARGDTYRARRFSRKDCAVWYENGILPYLDLTHWAATQGYKKVPDWVFGEAIYPVTRGINVGEAIRKTVRPLAERIMSLDLVSSIAADLYGETKDFDIGKKGHK